MSDARFEKSRKENEDKLDALFDELVPESGKADSVAGEIIRAVSRIWYRRWNDGDHVGVGPGKEECNPAARYLIETTDDAVKGGILSLWGVKDNDEYDSILIQVGSTVIRYIEGHPELKTMPNHVDMWDCRNEQEDRDEPEYEEW